MPFHAWGQQAATGRPDSSITYVYDQAEVEPPNQHLRGHVRIETGQMVLSADEVDYNEQTHYAEARGNVVFKKLDTGEELEAERAEYFLDKETGQFYGVKGSAPPTNIEPRPGLLTSDNPFYFEGEWAERVDNRYILYNGFITACKMPNPWWILKGPKFDIIPGDRAIAHKAEFKLRWMPLFYTPYFYKSLESRPRKSGLLTPTIGSSTRRGFMVGTGYYWAFDRSYDLTYLSQLFTQRGFAHHVDLRAKPTQTSEFNYIFYGQQDKGELLSDGGRGPSQGGYIMSFEGKAELPWGFHAQAEVNYLNSFVFRQAFTESYNEAVNSEVRSLAFASKRWDSYAVNIAFQRLENYQSTDAGDRITIRKLPTVEFQSRDRQLGRLPLWFSLDSSASLVRRNQPLFQTRKFVDRVDASPRLMTALRFRGLNLVPALTIRETHYGSSIEDNMVTGEGLLRSTREFTLDLIPPALARIFDSPPRWMGDRVKHVIETRAGFRWVSGIDDFDRFIRFDESEILADTREFDYSLTNRIFVKRGNEVKEVLSWQLWQKRYLDEDLGGAVLDGRRNVFLTQTELTAFAYFDQARHYSPVASILQFNPFSPWGVEWRSDYDPLRGRFTNSSLSANYRRNTFFVQLGHTLVRSDPVLTPNTNQLNGSLGWGRTDKPGWSLRFNSLYDFRTNTMQYATSQVSYNTDCCGLTLQYRRQNWGIRNDNVLRFSFTVANIGSFGTLRDQERIY